MNLFKDHDEIFVTIKVQPRCDAMVTGIEATATHLSRHVAHFREQLFPDRHRSLLTDY